VLHGWSIQAMSQMCDTWLIKVTLHSSKYNIYMDYVDNGNRF
jgi:hypothetical protein